MAVKELNKSDEARKLYKGGVKSAAEIVAKLKSRGIDIAPSQVYQVIAKVKGKRKAKTAHKTAATNHSPGEKETVIDHAVVFVRSAGGMAKAREMLSKLSLLHQ
jgi:uroporphyrinogen-III synthase